jgi:hypothetical protein
VRYDVPLRWIEDAEARRVASLRHESTTTLDQERAGSGADQTQSWIVALAARIAIQRVQFSSLKRAF